ncbi:His-Xaa-Ser system protein HxsD [Bradyrhizobium sp. USDA 4503]
MNDKAKITFEMSFDAGVHTAQSLARACYSLADIGCFRIENERARHLVACTTSLTQADAESRFRSAAIDFAVREDIEARTGGLRDLIWATAFAEAHAVKAE